MLLQVMASCRDMGLKRCLPGIRDTGLDLCPSTSPLPAACPSLPAQACPLSARSYSLPRLAHKLLRPSFLPAYPVPLPASLLPTHLPFSPRSAHLLPLRISGSALIYMVYSEPSCRCWLWCPRITYPHLSHSTLLTASREEQGFEGSRPRGRVKYSRQRQMCPEMRHNLNPFCIQHRSAMDVTHSLWWLLADK